MSILKDIAFFPILGKPLIMYGGLLTLVILLAAAVIGAGILKGKSKLPISAHVWLARTAIVIAIGHAILGLSLFF